MFAIFLYVSFSLHLYFFSNYPFWNTFCFYVVWKLFVFLIFCDYTLMLLSFLKDHIVVMQFQIDSYFLLSNLKLLFNHSLSSIIFLLKFVLFFNFIFFHLYWDIIDKWQHVNLRYTMWWFWYTYILWSY